MPAVLTIAGSDPSGGAGVQADLRVFSAVGVTGLSAITALTVQNSQGVQAVHPVDAGLLFSQIKAVLEDSAVQAIKIGMLGGAEQVEAVVAILDQFRPPFVVLDPVLASTGGVPLLSEAGMEMLLTKLLPLCSLVTPNIPELERLTGMPVEFGGNRYDAAQNLLDRGAQNVLIKGGHLKRAPVDVLIRPGNESVTYRAGRVQTPHTHGTGCFLASAIAACLAQELPLEDAVREAKKVLTAALNYPVVTGKGRGYPDVMAAMSEIRQKEEAKTKLMRNAERSTLLWDSLYVLTDSELRPDRSPEEITEQALAGGAKVIQLREKRLATPELVALAKRLVQQTRQANALLIINDRVDVALASDADGVHLGPDDMHPEDARRVLGPERLIGVSVASIAEAEPLFPFVDYFGVGAVFGSKTKKDAGDPIGLDRLREIKAHFYDMPVVAIGGINADNIAEVGRAGADSAAVVSAVVNAPDMRLAAELLLERFLNGRGKGQAG
jgi:hydroxymethylpyrimidine kinase/phosphomethylpyrimidine kinase/thiamine-phosphate diphosphorylase